MTARRTFQSPQDEAPTMVADVDNERLTSLRADAARSRESAATSTGEIRRQLLRLASDIDLHVANLETAWRKKVGTD